MKKRLLMVFAGLLIAVLVKAQQVQPGSQNGRIDHLSQIFSIEKSKAREIALALDFNMERLKSVARDTSMAAKAKMELLRKLHEERQAKIKATLTPQQLGILQAAVAEKVATQKEKMEQRRQAAQPKLQERKIMQGENKKKSDSRP